ncbi:MAG: CoA ester lyase [Acidisphaera sp.]|nr:CoA ester lyase [Acidisphaera sp.]
MSDVASGASATRALPRSLLFAPATSARKLEKAFDSAADGVIVDLEDSVAVSEKAAARAAAVQALQTPRRLPAYVRINATSTPFCFDDLLAVGGMALDGILLPKAESAQQIEMVDWLLSQIEAQHQRPTGSVAIIPLLETAQGIAAAASIARASRRLRMLGFGAVDLALDLDIDIDDETGAMAQARFALALASRCAGLPGPFDTAFPDIHDLDRLRASARRARAMGYRGKACIHPAQIETVNEVFTPTTQELERARRIVTAFDAAEAAGAAAVSVDGVMIDYPVVEKARRVLLMQRDA